MATGTFNTPGQESLNETCKAFNMRRESEEKPERMYPALIVRGAKDSMSLCEYGISLTVGKKDDIPQHRFITQELMDERGIDDCAMAMNEMLKDAMAQNRVAKLPWHKDGEVRTSQERWSGPYKNNPRG
jgi:hypothetical protein